MKKRVLKRTLIAVGVLAVLGTVGAKAYYSQAAAARVAARESATQVEATTGPGIDSRDPWVAIQADMRDMQAQMDQMYNAAFPGFHAVGASGPQANAEVSVEEKGDNYVVKANVPGANESDIDVNLDGRLLSISSQSRGDQKQTADNGQVIREESYANSFQQALTLPGPVNASGMQTQFKDGVLTVTIPKATS